MSRAFRVNSRSKLFCLGCALSAFAGTACNDARGGSESTGVLRAALGTAVFINELHYDNNGTDSGEAIEIAGPAGTELTGYSLVLYNGNGGAVYDTDVLSGTIANQSDGFGTVSLSYPSNGIQNGPTDGIALVRPDGSVAQFLSYEGSFTAVGGPANGMVALDIGVSENGTESPGLSLQLEGSGSNYEDFTWSAASPASFGAVNLGQSFSGGSDVPPAVASTVPAAGASGVEPAANLVITFSEPVSVTGDWFRIECSSSGAHTAAVSGGPAAYTLDPDLDLADGEACNVNVFASGVADVDGTPDPLAADVSFAFTVKVASVCGGPATKIHAVQGATGTSPLAGTLVTIEGVVVGDFQGSSGLGGFFVQEEDAEVDGDPLTSEGLFVFEGGTPSNVAAGDVVRVTGTVSEFFELTELANPTEVQICSAGASVAPSVVTLPVTSATALEPLEGMLVTFPQKLYVTETFVQGRFGEVMLAANGRQFTPTNLVEPGAPAQALAAANELARIQLDDGSGVQNPPAPPYVGADGTLRLGDSIEGVTGALGYAFGEFEVHPTTAPASLTFNRENPRPVAPTRPAGSLTVASFNVLNYFTTLDAGSPACGPSGGLDCRGADTASELVRQRDKILSALVAIDADILGLIELENNATAAIGDLVDGLNSRTATGTYAFLDTGTIGTDAIKVGIVYKRVKVVPVGPFAVLNSGVDPRFIDTLNRPVLAQTFEQLSTGARLTVAVNHLKSKGSECSGDPDLGDGQGNCNQTRRAAALAEVDWLASDPTGSADPDFLVIGDLNAYAKEDPIDAFLAGGYHDLIAAHAGAGAYSYVFQGEAGYLDHALASESLLDAVHSVHEWHINADEPVMLDYNQEFNPPALYSPGPYRSSDHDPVIVTFDLAEEPPPPAVPSCNGRPATVYVGSDGRIVGGPLAGTRYSGVLLGGTGSNVIVGTAGDDLIHTGLGGDTVCALAGNDIVLGGAGPDSLFGNEGNDLLQGGLGRDALSGGEGRDTLLGGAGVDGCDGGAGSDTQSGCEVRAGIP